MEHVARSLVYWPGITEDIKQKQESCWHCIVDAPANPRHISEQSDEPTAPFDVWCTNFSYHKGNMYLVMVDRFLGWIDVVNTPLGSSVSGVTGLVQALRRLFNSVHGQGHATAASIRRWPRVHVGGDAEVPGNEGHMP